MVRYAGTPKGVIIANVRTWKRVGQVWVKHSIIGDQYTYVGGFQIASTLVRHTPMDERGQHRAMSVPNARAM